jgi:hypothetical protein
VAGRRSSTTAGSTCCTGPGSSLWSAHTAPTSAVAQLLPEEKEESPLPWKTGTVTTPKDQKGRNEEPQSELGDSKQGSQTFLGEIDQAMEQRIFRCWKHGTRGFSWVSLVENWNNCDQTMEARRVVGGCACTLVLWSFPGVGNTGQQRRDRSTQMRCDDATVRCALCLWGDAAVRGVRTKPDCAWLESKVLC